MIGWIIALGILVYLVIALLMAKPALQLIMESCKSCSLDERNDRDDCLYYCNDENCWSPKTERTPELAAGAFVLGLLWPLFFPVAYVYFRTPLTPTESKIKLEQQQKEMDRLTKELDESFATLEKNKSRFS